MSEVVIKFENISKQYRLGLVTTRTLSHDLNRWWHVNVLRKEDPYLQIGETNERSTKGDSDYVWALKDINFEVEKGEVLGIIGRNGAGKSTLLKILSRVTTPTTGIIKVRGRIASLLEVGTGFHPELTGRENIYMNGSIMGMTRAEISSKLDEIVEFAGIARYLDTPAKRYSTGMIVRLGFAIAAHLEPDILVVDEVLAVGDAEFQKKAIGKMKEVSGDEGRTVLFISHQLNTIAALCKNSILLKNGKIHDFGPSQEVINGYLSSYEANDSSVWINTKNEYYSKYFKPLKIATVNEEGGEQSVFSKDTKVGIYIEGDVEAEHSSFCLGFALYDPADNLLYWSYNTDSKYEDWVPIKVGNNKLIGWIEPHILNEGDYRVELISSLHNSEWICQPGGNTPNVKFSIKGNLSESPLWQEARPGILAPVNRYQKI